jgi:hypothetical protein
MVTFFDLVHLLSVLIGLLVGGAAGSRFGPGGAIAGGLVGVVTGLYLGNLPTKCMVRREHRKLASFSTAELRAQLHDVTCWTPNFLLLELQARGEDIRGELPFVLSIMECEQQHRRTIGYAALCSAFPDVAKSLRTYNPMQPVEKCRLRIDEFRRRAELGAASPGGPTSSPINSRPGDGPPSMS